MTVTICSAAPLRFLRSRCGAETSRGRRGSIDHAVRRKLADDARDFVDGAENLDPTDGESLRGAVIVADADAIKMVVGAVGAEGALNALPTSRAVQSDQTI